MKAFFLALFLSVSLFANNNSLYRDDEIDLVIEVPADLQRTWNISNSQSGLSLTVFNNDEFEDNVNILVVGKIPLASLPSEEVADMIPMLFDEFSEDLTSQECCYLSDEVEWCVEKLMPVAPEFTDRYQVHLYLEEVEETITMDLHFFTRNGQSCLIMTGALEDPTFLNDFSETILANIRFIEGA